MFCASSGLESIPSPVIPFALPYAVKSAVGPGPPPLTIVMSQHGGRTAIGPPASGIVTPASGVSGPDWLCPISGLHCVVQVVADFEQALAIANETIQAGVKRGRMAGPPTEGFRNSGAKRFHVGGAGREEAEF